MDTALSANRPELFRERAERLLQGALQNPSMGTKAVFLFMAQSYRQMADRVQTPQN